MRFGPWMLPVFKVLRNLFLRGSALDPFGYTQERRTERALIREYEDTVARLLARLNSQNEASRVEIAAIPDEIRGFGHIKARNLAPARKKWQDLLARYEAGQAAQRRGLVPKSGSSPICDRGRTDVGGNRFDCSNGCSTPIRPKAPDRPPYKYCASLPTATSRPPPRHPTRRNAGLKSSATTARVGDDEFKQVLRATSKPASSPKWRWDRAA